MKVKNRKSVLLLIIILLLIFLPLAVLGTYNHLQRGGNGGTKNVNPEHQFKYDNRLYFYNGDTLLGTYDCKAKVCDYAYETVDDSQYNVNYYNDGRINQFSLINNRYAFIVDGDSSLDYYTDLPIMIYDVVDQKQIASVNGIKNYTVGIDGDLYILKNNLGKWGALKLNDAGITSVIPNSYDYIGLTNHLTEDNKINANTFIIKTDDGWDIMKADKTIVTSDIPKDLSSITDYNGKYLIATRASLYYLYNYTGNLLTQSGYNGIIFIDNYVGMLDSNKTFNIYNPVDLSTPVSSSYQIDDIKDISYVKDTSGIKILVNEEEKETLPILNS